MVFVLPFWVTPLVLEATYVYAIRRGDSEERTVAWWETGVLVTDILLWDTYRGHVERAVIWHCVGSLIQFSVILTVMFRSNKLWPMIYASTVLVCLMTAVTEHFVKVSGWAYGTTIFVWSYLECLILGVATWRAARARRAICILGAGDRSVVNVAG
jgi:hypothetical protein